MKDHYYNIYIKIKKNFFVFGDLIFLKYVPPIMPILNISFGVIFGLKSG